MPAGRGGRPRRVNQDVLDEMHRLRRSGYANREIAEKVGRSERTVRRYVGEVEPDVKLRPDFGATELMAWFYEKILVDRRSLVAAVLKEWGEVFELGVDAVDETTRALREHVRALDEITIKKMAADESYRLEFYEEFMAPVRKEWVSNLKGQRDWRQLKRSWPPEVWVEDNDGEHEF